MDYTEQLRRFALNDAQLADDLASGALHCTELDAKNLALVRLAALVAAGAAQPSFASETDAAVTAGATAAEIAEVLIAVVPIVGLPCVVAAAPPLAMALGYDTDDALAQ